MNPLDNQSRKDDRLFKIGQEILGPVIADYLEKLWQTCLYFEDVYDAKILFCTRAGLRIRQALFVFCASRGETVPPQWEHFWISRIMIAKGTWSLAPDVVAALFDKEFRHLPLHVAAKCITGTGNISCETAGDFSPEATRVGSALLAGDPVMAEARCHLDKQSALFDERLGEVLGDRSAALLVDTGWMGTSQRLLSGSYPKIDWFGAYFGLSGTEHDGDSRAHWSNAIGLVFEADQVDPDKPETCVIANRHLIEHLFEPDAPSIETYERREDGKIYAVGAEENLQAMGSPDPLFAGVLDYLTHAPRDSGALLAASRAAWTKLQKLVLIPSRADAELLLPIKRSANFGNSYYEKLLYAPENGSSSDKRLSKALWSAGQIALEYEPGMARTIQRKQSGLTLIPAAERKLTMDFSNSHPRVAIITRTMDRPLFLRRALLSVQQQSLRDYVHVIVSDGGELNFIEETIRSTPIEHGKILLIDNVANRGMEAASNIGIAASSSDYLVVHDDDDTWAPDFLDQTVNFLDAPEGAKYGGVVTRSYYVSESVRPEGIEVHEVRPYHANLEAPTFHSMLKSNTFPPISFLFRRSAYNDVGQFLENYRVLGDWEFNLRFLERHDIALLPLELAYYHHRDTHDIHAFGNSVISGRSLHQSQLPIMRNAYLRRASEGPVQVAAASALSVTVQNK